MHAKSNLLTGGMSMLQGIVLPVTIAVGLIALLAPLYMAFFVNYLDLGLYGAPIATGNSVDVI